MVKKNIKILMLFLWSSEKIKTYTATTTTTTAMINNNEHIGHLLSKALTITRVYSAIKRRH